MEKVYGVCSLKHLGGDDNEDYVDLRNEDDQLQHDILPMFFIRPTASCIDGRNKIKIPSPNLFWFAPRSTWTVASRLPGRTSKVQEPGNQLWLSLITDHDHFMLCPLYD